MKNLLAAIKLALADIAKLETPAMAAAVAGVVVPIIVAIAGVKVTAAEVGGWLILADGIAATLQKLPVVKQAAVKGPAR